MNSVKKLVLLFMLSLSLALPKSNVFSEENPPITLDEKEFIVFRVKITPASDSAQDGTDGGPFEVEVEPATLTETTWTWSWEAPSATGNNPSCKFNPINVEPTTITGRNQAKWFALPDDPCSANPSSTYTIKCTVTINGVQFNATPASFSVTLPLTAGETISQDLTGFPSYAYDSINNIWKVTGPGTLARQSPNIDIKLTQNSQFYDKVKQHEDKHMDDIVNGFDRHQFWTVSEFYPTIQNLTTSTEVELLAAIQVALWVYRAQEIVEFNSLESCFEYRAYQVSDLIAPQYFYQSCGEFSGGDCQ